MPLLPTRHALPRLAGLTIGTLAVVCASPLLTRYAFTGATGLICRAIGIDRAPFRILDTTAIDTDLPDRAVAIVAAFVAATDAVIFFAGLAILAMAISGTNDA